MARWTSRMERRPFKEYVELSEVMENANCS
jgi:hypothetical protein